MQDTNLLDAFSEVIEPKIQVVGENRFVVEPLERGYGVTLGNSLRRVLLSSLVGAAVTHIRIEGVLHEFSTIPGIVEDTTAIILNLKKLRMRLDDTVKPGKMLHIQASGEGVVTAADILEDAEVEILNPELVIAHLTAPESKLVMDLYVSFGTGYVTVEKQSTVEQSIGVIPIDSFFSPVVRVHYEVLDTRVGQRTDFDRLVLEVETDGSIMPYEAVAKAAQILQDRLDLFVGLQMPDEGIQSEISGDDVKDDISIDELNLSARASHCLKSRHINTVSELLKLSEAELIKLKNFGQKSLVEVKDCLSKRGLALAPDIEN